MLQAYLGLISRQGLEVFCPEHPQALRFLERRVRRTPGPALCFWSVLPDDAACQVQSALQHGLPAAAFQVLQQTAWDAGSLIPESTSSVDEDGLGLPR